MLYAIFGPFTLEEARAISTSDPSECTPFEFGDKTHLESVGSASLLIGGIEWEKGCKSHHFGGELSTIAYKDAEMMLCQINDPLQGIYVCAEDTAEIFQNGFNGLRKEKMDPESDLNMELDRRRKELKEMIKDTLKNTVNDYAQKISDSWILKPSDQKVLRSMWEKFCPYYISEEEMMGAVESFYAPEHFGRTIHIGKVMSYFNLPTAHLVVGALKEHEALKKKSSFVNDYHEMLLVSSNREEMLFKM